MIVALIITAVLLSIISGFSKAICDLSEEGVFTVKFDYGCFLAYDGNGEQVGILSELSTMFVKVIGNIHDNKELLQ